MSVTKSTISISPQSFMVVHTSPSSTSHLPKTTLTSTLTSSTNLKAKSRSGSMSIATTTTTTSSSSGTVRQRVVARSFSVSTPSTSASASVSASMASWYPITPLPVQAHSGTNDFDVFIDAQGSLHDPYLGEIDLATSSRLHLEYLGNNNGSDLEARTASRPTSTDYNEKENFTAISTTHTILPRRPRERARSTRQDTRELMIPRSTSTVAKTMLEETFEETSRNPLASRQFNDQPRRKPVKMNFWESELAAKKELEEDDYAWYYRNPQRHIWRPRNPRKRITVQRRKRVMCGVATGEEGSPTNRSLFTAYLMKHFPSTLLLPPVGFETEAFLAENQAPVEGKPPANAAAAIRRSTTASLVVDGPFPGYVNEDWQEDLFPPDEHDPSCDRRWSLHSERSHLTDSSADSSPRIHDEDTFCNGCLGQYHTHLLPSSRAAINAE